MEAFVNTKISDNRKFNLYDKRISHFSAFALHKASFFVLFVPCPFLEVRFTFLCSARADETDPSESFNEHRRK